jgi:hypothetical protein
VCESHSISPERSAELLDYVSDSFDLMMKYLALTRPSPKTSLDRNASTCSQEALARLQQRGELRTCAGFWAVRTRYQPRRVAFWLHLNVQVRYHTGPLSIARLRVLYTSPESSGELIHTCTCRPFHFTNADSWTSRAHRQEKK